MMSSDDPVINQKIGQKINLATVIDESCTFYEEMEKRKKGSLEAMLDGIKDKIETGKVRIEKEQRFDPNR